MHILLSTEHSPTRPEGTIRWTGAAPSNRKHDVPHFFLYILVPGRHCRLNTDAALEDDREKRPDSPSSWKPVLSRTHL